MGGSVLGIRFLNPVRRITHCYTSPGALFVVREPFVSKASSASIVSGAIDPGKELILESLMPSSGVIFSDGIESDFLEFNSGSIVHIRAAEQRAKLVVS